MITVAILVTSDTSVTLKDFYSELNGIVHTAGWAVNDDDAGCRVSAKTVDAHGALWLFCRRRRSACPLLIPI